jgi:hypothetical protein
MTQAPLPFVSGSGTRRLAFEDLDQRGNLQIRALIGLCMPPVFADLEQRFDLLGLRKQGTSPIMFFLQFETLAQPLPFLGRMTLDYRVHLRRSVLAGPPGSAAGRVERLLLDMEIDVRGPQGSGDPAQLGAGALSERLVPAGRMRGVHVITRPVAAPGERQVRDVPAELRGLQEQPWEGPYPSTELLEALPAGFRERAAGPWQELRSVWALHNTDVNQHVNVHEYIMSMENHFARMLFGASLPLARHRIARMEILFRKPFFMGDAHGLRGRLFTSGRRTLLLGGLHRVEPEGGLEPRPAVFARMEGELEESAE